VEEVHSSEQHVGGNDASVSEESRVEESSRECEPGNELSIRVDLEAQ
jgi:hypothetical protein